MVSLITCEKGIKEYISQLEEISKLCSVDFILSVLKTMRISILRFTTTLSFLCDLTENHNEKPGPEAGRVFRFLKRPVSEREGEAYFAEKSI